MRFCKLKNKYIRLIIISIVVMILLPKLTVMFFNVGSAKESCLYLFFSVNPLYCIAVGRIAGKNEEELWAWPLIPAFAFLIGSWIVLEYGDPEYVIFTAGYVSLGYITMLISSAAADVKNENKK